MDDAEIHNHINTLIEQEHELRQKLTEGDISVADEQAKLDALEATLDQYWDLLRQRRARREFAQNPDLAKTRPVDVVESYEQ